MVSGELFSETDVEQFLFRCYTETGYVDIVATSEDQARHESGADVVKKLYSYPMPTLDDIRSQWIANKSNLEWLKGVREWIVAAVRMKIIDAEKFEEIEKSLNNAIDNVRK